MVTLAFAQAGSILAFKNPHKWTGGEEGLGADYTKLPQGLVGIFNTKHLYWLALGYAAVRLPDRAAGRCTRRRGTCGRRSARTSCAWRSSACGPYAFKLMSFVLASFLATAGGVVYLLAARRRDARGDVRRTSR